MSEKKTNEDASMALGISICLGLVALFIAFISWAYPTYQVWRRQMEGKAELAQASYNRQISIQEAHAKMESATLLATAEVERAKGVAQANQIIGASLQNNEAYLRYLWIDSLHNNNEHSIIYVPTEAGLPILEAGRRPNRLEKELSK